MKEWYDGYAFGGTEVYNPWSVINFMYDLYGFMYDLQFKKQGD